MIHRQLHLALERVKKWLAADQPGDAVIHHLGSDTEATFAGIRLSIQAAAQGRNQAWLCVNLQEQWQEIVPGKTCPHCSHHQPAESIEIEYSSKQKEAILAAVRKVFGRASVIHHWGGMHFISVELSVACSKSLCDAFKRYLDGCPDCGGTVFCGTSNHKWRLGFEEAVQIPAK